MTGPHRAPGAGDRGALAILLHTHMPYVEGFGTWPFGEEWLWEAMAGCYLPLADLLDTGAPLTLSLTPVLCDQLEGSGVAARFCQFVADVRSFTHSEDARGLRDTGRPAEAAELDRSWGDYTGAVARLHDRDDDLLEALSKHASWTSSATHAILPLIGSDAVAGAQVRAGVAAHRARTDKRWGGGFWLPECAHAPHLDRLLASAGVRHTCVELTSRFGLGASEHLRPLLTAAGVVLVPIDRATIDLVWGARGYPANGAYRDYHRRTWHNHCPWANDGSAYDHERARAAAQSHAADFVARTLARLRDSGGGLPGGGLVVCAIDTELFGHWWYEGIAWLAAVVDECARQGLALVALDEALAHCDPLALDDSAAPWEPSSWGAHGDLSTWSGFVAAAGASARTAAEPELGDHTDGEPTDGEAAGGGHTDRDDADTDPDRTDGAGVDPRFQVAELAFATRAAELSLLRAGAAAGTAALRALFAVQSSDWAFMIARKLAGPYALERFEAHRQTLRRTLAEGPAADAPDLRNIARHADAEMLSAS
jgi:1,4-alpha-glucan branching enzyme